jgi:hypothetical protein
MRILVIFIIFWLGSNQLNAQWYQVNTNTTENLYDLFFVDSLEGYCVGGTDEWGTPQSTGVILKTIDGGENWTTIFSLDSITINSIAVVQENENTKLYAFALKNGISHLVSTFTNTAFQNWSVEPMNYIPLEVRAYNNEIFYKDFLSNELNKISNSLTSNIGVVEMYGLSSSGLLVIQSWSDDSLYHSPLFDTNFVSINSHDFSSVIGQNQSYNAVIIKNEDQIILKGTYQSAVVFSLDNGNTWNYNYGGGEGKSLITDSSQILSINYYSDEILQTNDFGQSWQEVEISGNVFLNVGYSSHSNTLFVIGQNGAIYKNANTIPVGTVEKGLKNKINIYPNPSQDIMQIETSVDIQFKSIELYDINGRFIKQIDKNARILNFVGIPAGTYLVKIETNDGSFTKKVIIE